MTPTYRTLALVPSCRDHEPRALGGGTVPTFCKPPGFWARLWGRVRDGTVWTCWCGRQWRWQNWQNWTVHANQHGEVGGESNGNGNPRWVALGRPEERG